MIYILCFALKFMIRFSALLTNLLCLICFIDFFAGNAVPNPEDLNSYAKEMLVAQRDLEYVQDR